LNGRPGAATPPDDDLDVSHPGAGLDGRCSTAIAPTGSGLGVAAGGSDAADAEANDTTTNDRLAMHDTKANAAHAAFALHESRSNFTDCMTFPFRHTGQRCEERRNATRNRPLLVRKVVGRVPTMGTQP
jgi:hypothetical protein